MVLHGTLQVNPVFVQWESLISILEINVFFVKPLNTLTISHFNAKYVLLICTMTSFHLNAFGVLLLISLIVLELDANVLNNLHISIIKHVFLALYHCFGMIQQIFALLVIT